MDLYDQSSTRSPDYKALFLKEAELRKQEEERRKQAERRNQLTTFEEFIRACHTLLSIP
jgi:acyl-[acyl carrier protein]--UDP-N-acetylglucosamine O-acyltransferase